MINWTPTRIKLMVKLFQQGRTYTEIGQQMKLTKGQISGKLSRLGIRRATPVQEPKRSFVKEAIAAPVIRGMIDLGPNDCRWPMESGKFCGSPQCKKRWPYCEEHHERARRKFQ